MYDFGKDLVNRGWICPRCGSVFSPYALECHYCNKGTGFMTTNDGAGAVKELENDTYNLNIEDVKTFLNFTNMLEEELNKRGLLNNGRI